MRDAERALGSFKTEMQAITFGNDMRVNWQEIVGLFLLAIPIACVARTVVFEEVFREPRDYCVEQSKACHALLARKFFYLFTCEYCFSHYVTAAFLIITRFHLLFDDWRGYLVSFFSLVFVANLYLNLYSRMRVEITVSKKEAEAKAKELEKLETEICEKRGETPQPRKTSSSDGHESKRDEGTSEPVRA